MKKVSFFQCTMLAGVLLSFASPLSADIIFSLLPPDGNVSGPPGSLLGWGYSLTNTDPLNWFMTTALNSDSFANGTPTQLFDFPILAPGEAATEAFDPVSSIGLFELQWDPGAPPAFVNSGNFVLSGQWFDGDPFNGGNFIADAPDMSLAYTATVGGGGGTVPEPSGFLLLGSGIAAIIGWRKFRNRPPARVAVNNG